MNQLTTTCRNKPLLRPRPPPPPPPRDLQMHPITPQRCQIDRRRHSNKRHRLHTGPHRRSRFAPRTSFFANRPVASLSSSQIWYFFFHLEMLLVDSFIFHKKPGRVRRQRAQRLPGVWQTLIDVQTSISTVSSRPARKPTAGAAAAAATAVTGRHRAGARRQTTRHHRRDVSRRL